VMAMGFDQVTAFGKSPQTVTARSLLCFWAYRKPGMTTIEIGGRLNWGMRVGPQSHFDIMDKALYARNREEEIGKRK
jgi:REP-associated tyrosine transposase